MISDTIICIPVHEKLSLRPSCCLAREFEIIMSMVTGSNYNNHSQHVQQSYNKSVVEQNISKFYIKQEQRNRCH